MVLNSDQTAINTQSQNVKHIALYSSLYTIFQVLTLCSYYAFHLLINL